MKGVTMYFYRFFIGILMLLSMAVYGQFSVHGPVAEPVPNNAPTYYQHERNVARTGAGVIVVAWQDNASAGQIVASTYDETFQIWSPPVQVSFAGDQADKVGLISDSQGRVHAAWQQRETSGSPWQIFYASYDGAFWTSPVKVNTDETLDAEETSIIADSNDDLWVVWNTDAEPDSMEWLRASKSTDGGATWSAPSLLSSPDGIIGGGSTTSGRASLWAGSGGKVVAIWHEEPDGVGRREIFVNRYDGAAWGGEEVISDVTDTTVSRHWHPTIAMDSQDNIYAAFSSDRSGSDPREILLYTTSFDGAWPTQGTVVITETAADFLSMSMTVTQNDDIYLGYRRDIASDTSFSIDEIAVVASGNGGNSWSDPVVVSRANHDAGYVTLIGNASSSGVDVTWRESYTMNDDNGDTTSVMHATLDNLVGIEDEVTHLPDAFSLEQNYPNPFNPVTSIEYTIQKAGDYELAIYNVTGQKIRTLVNGKLTVGAQESEWDGTNDRGIQVASGIYFYQLSGNGLTLTRKMALLK